jgi:FkbM family methyltransferase
MKLSSKFRALLRPIAIWAMSTRPYLAISHSQGDWRYLYLSFAWWFTQILVPRRRVRVGDVSFTLQCDNWITHFRWYLFRTKEVEVRHYIDTHLKEGDVFFDIGANIGVFSLYASKRHKNLQTFCFEPEYSNLHYLKENILKNGLMDQANIYSIAVSDTDGLSALHVQDVTPGAAVHTESKTDINMTDEGYAVVWREGVAIRTLDSLCRDLKTIPNAIKIDTDGNELKILTGATETLKAGLLRSIVLEMPPTEQGATQCAEILSLAGFKLDWSRDDTRNEVWVRAN